MSQTPLDVHAPGDAPARYRRAWAAINRLLEEGRSLSGYERHCAFLNTRGGRFAEVSAATGLDLIDDGRAVAAGDWDGDGRVDLWVSNRTSPRLRLLRNESRTGHHWLAVRLRGRRCAADAIGARVEVYVQGTRPRRLLRTLRAGEGFLAQSSKWLHFGLGEHETVGRLVVHWPDGSSQTFDSLAAGGRYVLVQDQPQPQRTDRPATAIRGRRAPLAALPRREARRVFFASRLPLPALAWQDFGGRPHTLVADGRCGTLVVLWASWCRPCWEELQTLAGGAAELKAGGVDVLALSVDELSQEPAGSAAHAKAALERLGVSLPAGMATAETVGVLEAAQRALIDKPTALPLPCAVLVDPWGQVAAVYRGPTDVPQVLADVRRPWSMLDSQHGAHFPGRWHTAPPPADGLLLVRNLVEFNVADRAAAFLEAWGTATGFADSPRLAEGYVYLSEALARRGDRPAAVEALRHAVALAPRHVTARTLLADQLRALGRHAELLPHLLTAVELAPQDAELRKRLILAQAAVGQYAASLPHAQHLADAKPGDPVARLYLAKALKSTGQAQEAIAHYRQALKLRPDWIVALNDLAWTLATHPDDNLRDPAEALRLAQRACDLAEQPAAMLQDTLAAAQAACGDCAAAVRTQRQAIALAASGGAEAADGLRRRLALYERGEAYREDPQRGPSAGR